jgi:pilus assembly protein CpaF
VRRSAGLVTVEPGWRADGGPCPAADRLAELLGSPSP